jgi:4-alpha-glucanotransferase
LRLSRSSGILLHPTSLPGSFGIGDFGDEARGFIDFLAAAGQHLWQVLPLGPTGYGNSPYQSLSAFAGNTLLIAPRQLIADGLLAPADVAHPELPEDHVEFEAVRKFKDGLLAKTYENFKRESSSSLREEFAAFCETSAWWLDDYALFRALKDTQGGREWTAWDRDLSDRLPGALERARDELQNPIAAQKFCQFLFFRQWQALRDYARARDIRIVGDLPIFVAHDSADVWAHREYFKLDETGKPTMVAGVPPDYFSATGQLWGNPVYDWERLRAAGFKWWIDRVRFALEQFDFLRIDHFRGFAACWEIPAHETTAQNGQWIPTPGREVFAALTEALGDLPIIAENLGVITPDVESLREEFGFPGMRVLQFAFGSDAANVHLPHNYKRDVTVYTGTHDNDTTAGWFASLSESETNQTERDFCLEYVGSSAEEINWNLIRAAQASVADTAIVPLQDVLGLGSEARMNLPASQAGNWIWRLKAGALTDEVAWQLKELAELYGRDRYQ